MKKSLWKIAILVIAIGLWSCGSNSSAPEDVAVSFYNCLNTGDIEGAKELARPSAQDYIDNLAELDVFEGEGDTDEFRVMEVEKPEEPIEGDTAIVNYKIGEFASFIKLVFTDDRWQVDYNEQIKHIRIININSYDFAEENLQEGWKYLWEKYENYRLRIKNVLCYRTYYGYDYGKISFAFDKNGNEILTNESYTKNRSGAFCDNEYKISYDSDFCNFVVNSTEEVKKKLLDYDENVGFKTLFNFEGVLSGYSYGSFFFNNCSVNILKSCE